MKGRHESINLQDNCNEPSPSKRFTTATKRRATGGTGHNEKNMHDWSDHDKVDERQTKTSKRSGRWTPDEHERFLEALELYGRDWRKIQDYVGTRTSEQSRSHAQKYFAKISRRQNAGSYSPHTNCSSSYNMSSGCMSSGMTVPVMKGSYRGFQPWTHKVPGPVRSPTSNSLFQTSIVPFNSSGVPALIGQRRKSLIGTLKHEGSEEDEKHPCIGPLIPVLGSPNKDEISCNDSFLSEVSTNADIIDDLDVRIDKPLSLQLCPLESSLNFITANMDDCKLPNALDDDVFLGPCVGFPHIDDPLSPKFMKKESYASLNHLWLVDRAEELTHYSPTDSLNDGSEHSNFPMDPFVAEPITSNLMDF